MEAARHFGGKVGFLGNDIGGKMVKSLTGLGEQWTEASEKKWFIRAIFLES